jgi:hypothetical protein
MMLAAVAAGIGPPNVGLSLVFWPEWVSRSDDEGVLVLEAFRRVDSADIVFSPAADGRILEALSTSVRANLYDGPTRAGTRVLPYWVNDFIDDGPAGSRRSRVKGENLMEIDKNVGVGSDGEERAGGERVQEWIDAARRSAVPAMLLRSGLPEASQERLRNRVYESPQDLQDDIEAELVYLGRLSEDRVVNLPGSHPRGAGGHPAGGGRSQLQVSARVSGMMTGLDHARNAVDYLFGVPDAAVPEPMLRRSDMLYVALTGDYEWHGVFRPERVMLTGADTTTLANLATNAMNKVVQSQLSLLTFYRWYEKIAVPTANDGSLHDMSWISFGGITTLPSVPEKGSYSELDVDDVKESDSFTKYGG